MNNLLSFISLFTFEFIDETASNTKPTKIIGLGYQSSVTSDKVHT